MKTLFCDRLKKARKHSGLKQHNVAEKMGGSTSRIGNYESGEREPRLDEIEALADIFDVSFSWLATGEGSMLKGQIAETRGEYSVNNIARQIPLIDWDDVGAEQRGSIKKVLVSVDEVTSNAFALQLKGDSMHSPSGQLSLPEGCVIVVDKALGGYQDGDIVVGKINGKTVCKQLVDDCGKKYLKSLNPIYPLLPVDTKLILLGVVKSYRFTF